MRATVQTPDEMRRYMGFALELAPHVVIDDGGDLVELLHESHRALGSDMLGACEETTSGVLRARARAKAGRLRFPVVLVNDARCKYLFDNVHGTGQSVWDAVLRSTNLVLAGKTVVVVGYGWCGRGVALRAQGLGAHVVVCEVDPIKAADALMYGCRVLPLADACRIADVVLTVTGVRHTLRREHFPLLKHNVLLANAGHFSEEIDVAALAELAAERQELRSQRRRLQARRRTVAEPAGWRQHREHRLRRRPSRGDHGHELRVPAPGRAPRRHAGRARSPPTVTPFRRPSTRSWRS